MKYKTGQLLYLTEEDVKNNILIIPSKELGWWLGYWQGHDFEDYSRDYATIIYWRVLGDPWYGDLNEI